MKIFGGIRPDMESCPSKTFIIIFPGLIKRGGDQDRADSAVPVPEMTLGLVTEQEMQTLHGIPQADMGAVIPDDLRPAVEQGKVIFRETVSVVRHLDICIGIIVLFHVTDADGDMQDLVQGKGIFYRVLHHPLQKDRRDQYVADLPVHMEGVGELSMVTDRLDIQIGLDMLQFFL